MELKMILDKKIKVFFLITIFIMLDVFFTPFLLETALAQTVAIVGEEYTGHSRSCRNCALTGLDLPHSQNDDDVIIVSNSTGPFINPNTGLEDPYIISWSEQGYNSWEECVVDMGFDIASMSRGDIALGMDIRYESRLNISNIGMSRASHGSGAPFYTLGFTTTTSAEGRIDYNPSNIEFVVSPNTSASCATAIVAGYLARILREKPGWNYYDARAALRQTASEYTNGWDDGSNHMGYGILDIDAALQLDLVDLDLFPPILYDLNYDSINRELTIQWVHYNQSDFDKTVIALFDEEPVLSAGPDDTDMILYSGSSDTSGTFYCRGQLDNFWIGLFTLDSSGNYSKLEEYAKIEVEVEAPTPPPEAQVDILVTLEGKRRPDPEGWEVPVTVSLYHLGADVINDTPVYEFNMTTSKQGDYAVCQVNGIAWGKYDITVDSEHTLMNVIRGVWLFSPNVTLDMGTLLEGDCNDDGAINGLDRFIAGDSWAKCIGDPDFDARADFDRNGCVTRADYRLFKHNLNKCSPIEIFIEEARAKIFVTLECSDRAHPKVWKVPATVGFFAPGSNVINGCPIVQHDLMTKKSGGYAVCKIKGIQPGVYDITFDSEHTLMNVKRSAVISEPKTAVDMGTILEGDFNDDGVIDLHDFGIFKASLAKSIGDPDFDARADFDRNGHVNETDYTLFINNYGKCSPIEVE